MSSPTPQAHQDVVDQAPPALTRAEAERILAQCEPGTEGFLEACDQLTRRKLAALCRAYLANLPPDAS